MKKTLIPLRKSVNDSYRIEIFRDGFNHIAEDLARHKFGSSYIIITDSNTKKLFGRDFQLALKRENLKADLLEVPAGEKSKKWSVAGNLLSKLVKLKATRKSCVIALGGGVIGDLAGFVASAYMRGIPYIQVPTSLLAMVDSSVGGKTGVDLPEGKNLAGSFWQPKKVYMPLHVLRTLPERQIRTGLAEVVKYGCIWDRKFFRFLERVFKKMLKKQQKKSGKKDKTTADVTWLTKEKYDKILTEIIRRSVMIKRNVVRKDEKETRGVRAVLNYGHTVGHAVENLSRFKLTHGEAISIGMNYEAKLAHKLGYLREKEMERQEELLKLIGLPTDIPKSMNREKLIEIMKSDKKSVFGKIGFVLVRRMGRPIRDYVVNITPKAINKIIKK
jgi:3-dehydroquinate synthase